MNPHDFPPRAFRSCARYFVAAVAFACVAFALPAAAQTVATLSNSYSAPQFVAVNADKTIFVTDTTYALSALFLVNGAYTTSPTAYDTNFDGLFDSPQGVAVDHGGDVFATTNLNASSVGLWEFRPPDYANIYAESTSNDGGVAHGLALDSHGNWFVADSNAVVFELPASGNYSFAVPISAGQSGTDHPFGIAFDNNDNLFVTDQLSSSGQIVELTAASGYATRNTITSGNLRQPVGVALDSRGNLYVTDSALNTLTEFLAPDYTTAAVIDSTHFSGPMGVALDADDNIFVVDTGHNALKEIPAQPAVTGLAPAAGPVAGGTAATITGVHLTGTTSISFGGNTASSFTVVSDTEVTATAPAGSGTVDVRVTTPNGTSVAAPSDKYAYTSGPTVGSLNPGSGPTAGGNSVTITGTNLTSASAVSFGGTAATSFSVLGATQINAVAPPGAAGTVDVTVTTPGGTSPTGAADHYTYVSAPTVSGMSPNSGPTAGGTSVTITGANFAGTTAVQFGGAAATNVTVVSATQIAAMAPAGSAGTVDVTVTTPDGTSATGAADSFTYVAAPVVSGVSPSSGSTAGGAPVTISGLNFTGVTAVSFGGTAATFTVTSATAITATAPAGSLSTVDVRVTTAGGTSATSPADHFTFVAVPAVSGVSPAAGPLAGGTAVTITGSNFTGATAVHFAATAATNVTVVSATQITATAPAGSAGTIDVTVTTPNGTSPTNAADAYTYVAAPSVTSITPAAGSLAGGTAVSITGTNFTGATAIAFGGIAATFIVNSATSITATSPAGTGTVDITVTTAGGTSATSPADQFAYAAAPTVTSISPSLGSTVGGAAVTITGTNFTGATAVSFGGSAATSFAVNSATSITATSPAGAGTVDVKVTTPGGTSATSAADRFTYSVLPTVTAVSPNGGPPTGGTSVTITGINFTSVTAVKFGAAAAGQFTVNSATSITATSPPAAVGAVDVTVTTNQGTSTASAADKFTYAVPKAMQQGNKLVGTGNAGAAAEGISIALSADGNTLVLGGVGDSGSTGAVWAFTRNGTTWTQQGAKFVGSGSVGTAREGASVALSADGNTVLFGGYLDNGNIGAAWVFTRNGSTWTQQGAKLIANDESGNGRFGISVALSSDGNTALVGGSSDNVNTGAAWVFTRSGTTWMQQGAKLTAGDESGQGNFGFSVGLSSDGNTAVIGGDSDNNSAGAAWGFTRSGTTWTQQGAKLTASDESGQGSFGFSVGLSSDGNTAVVGGISDNNSAGAAWGFTRSGTTWTQQGAKLTASGENGQGNFGFSVALSADGNTAAVGGLDDNGNSGAVWLFTQNSGIWSQKGSKLVGSGNIGAAGQGVSVALSGKGSALAEGGFTDNGNIGAAWVFTVDTMTASHDFNGDSKSDILWRNTAGDTTVWLMNGAGIAQGSSLGPVPNVWSVAGIRDFNGDGDADILWRDAFGDTTMWLMNGTSITQGSSIGNIPTAWSVAGTGDFNGDSKGDILWRDTSGDTTIWFMNGGAITGSTSLGNVPTSWSVAGTGDFNGDGTSDILWRDTVGDIAIWEMSAGSIKQGVGLGNLPATWSVAGTGDFNGDDTSDILWRDTAGDVMIWLISNGALQQQSVLGNMPTVWSVAETGDFNGDNNTDILWTDTSGNVMIWFMNGINVTSTASLGNVGAAWSVQGNNGD